MADTAKADASRLNMSPATLLDAVKDLQELEDRKTSIIGKIRARRKAAKEAGVNLREMDAVIALKRMDPDEIRANEEDRLKYCKWLGVNLGFQASLELPEPDAKHVEKLTKYDTHRGGYEAGKRGDPRNSNPHEVGTIAHASWDQGWNDGDNDVFQAAKPPAKPRAAKKGAGPEMGPTDEQKDAGATDKVPDATEPASPATSAVTSGKAADGSTIQ